MAAEVWLAERDKKSEISSINLSIAWLPPILDCKITDIRTLRLPTRWVGYLTFAIVLTLTIRYLWHLRL